jgi:ABC-type polysaccharide/polyol phosphate export permease
MGMKGLIASVYIGIQVESNWTKKPLYLLYLFASPIASIFTVIIIYGMLGGNLKSDLFYFALFGSLFYYFLADTFFNTAFSVIDDREHYRVLKYIIDSKTKYYTYTLGRGVGKAILTLISITMNLLWIIPVLKIHISFQLFPLIAGLSVGFVGALGLALAFSGYYLLSIRSETSLMDVLFGGLFLISGAMFSPTILPGFLKTLATYFPLTSTIEMLRFAFFGKHLSQFLAGTPFSQFFGLFLMTNLISFVVGFVLFELALKSAIKKGYLDITTAF